MAEHAEDFERFNLGVTSADHRLGYDYIMIHRFIRISLYYIT